MGQSAAQGKDLQEGTIFDLPVRHTVWARRITFDTFTHRGEGKVCGVCGVNRTPSRTEPTSQLPQIDRESAFAKVKWYEHR